MQVCDNLPKGFCFPRPFRIALRRKSSRELWIASLGMKAVLPPPEEQKDVKTAIGAARAEKAGKAYLNLPTDRPATTIIPSRAREPLNYRALLRARQFQRFPRQLRNYFRTDLLIRMAL